MYLFVDGDQLRQGCFVKVAKLVPSDAGPAWHEPPGLAKKSSKYRPGLGDFEDTDGISQQMAKAMGLESHEVRAIITFPTGKVFHRLQRPLPSQLVQRSNPSEKLLLIFVQWCGQPRKVTLISVVSWFGVLPSTVQRAAKVGLTLIDQHLRNGLVSKVQRSLTISGHNICVGCPGKPGGCGCCRSQTQNPDGIRKMKGNTVLHIKGHVSLSYMYMSGCF